MKYKIMAFILLFTVMGGDCRRKKKSLLRKEGR